MPVGLLLISPGDFHGMIRGLGARGVRLKAC